MEQIDNNKIAMSILLQCAWVWEHCVTNSKEDGIEKVSEKETITQTRQSGDKMSAGSWRKRYDNFLALAKEGLQAESPGETITDEDAKAEIDFNIESDFYQEAEGAVGSERVDEIAKEMHEKHKTNVLSELTVDNILDNHNGHWKHGDAVYGFSYFGFRLNKSETRKGKYDLTVNTKWHDGTSYNPYYSREFKGLSDKQAETLMKEAASKEMDRGSIVVPLSRLVQELEKQEEEKISIERAEQETDTNPTEAQKAAGNYKKGHLKIDGYDITIENPKGSTRSGRDASGKKWEIEMQNTYGYIRGTEGVDGYHIDVFLSDNPSEGAVFVVDQINADGSFDEHKVMYGFPDAESARKAYFSKVKKSLTKPQPQQPLTPAERLRQVLLVMQTKNGA